MPHNAIASQAASGTLLTPLVAVRQKDTWNFPNFIREKKSKSLVTINDGDGKGESLEAERKQKTGNTVSGLGEG